LSTINKNDGGRGLTSNDFKVAYTELAIHSACLFTGLVVHGSVIDDVLLSAKEPIPKGRRVNQTDSDIMAE